MSHRQRGRYTTAQQSQVNARETTDEEEYNDIWPTRMPSSARRYQGLADVRTEVGRIQADVQPQPTQRTLRGPYAGPNGKSAIPPRRTATQTDIPAVSMNRQRPSTYTDDEDEQFVSSRHSGELTRAGNRPRIHWLVFVGIAMLTMMLGWVVLSNVMQWWQVTQDDWHYGRPRTYQTDAVVGHNDSATNQSHFLALNLNRHIQIIEFPGGDSSKAKIYIGPTLTGDGQDLAVVTLTFKDVNGDGKPDMIVNVQGSRFVFINDNGEFRTVRPGENVQL